MIIRLWFTCFPFSRFAGERRCGASVVLFEPLREFVDILRRPASDFHPEMQAHLRKHFLDFVQGFAAEVGGPEHFGFGPLDEIADVDNIVVLQAVRRAHGQFEFVDLLEQRGVEGEFRDRRCRFLRGAAPQNSRRR